MFGYLLTSGLLQYAAQSGHFILQCPFTYLLRQPRWIGEAVPPIMQ